mmetsp:Transcript_18118/g.56796  ORF Transcript_18118/g.56796 Transcript_18118/m.56796 type:complete len:462 (+) Transcript_18118:95-1480(+)
MLRRNGLLFIVAQFGSRFANSFLTTAVRFELLEAGGVSKFASAQVANQVARVFMSQVSGLLTDNFPLKRLYVAGEAVNLLLVVGLLLSSLGLTTGLIAVNVGLGLTQAFMQPVAKSMPPAVVSKEDLAVVNSWDLTGDKVAKNLAPMAFAFASSTAGFRSAIMFCALLYSALVAMKQLLSITERPARANGSGSAAEGRSAMRRILSVFRQVWEGLLTLGYDRTIGLLILNTLCTNVLVYPLSSIVFPVIFKEIPEGAIEGEGSVISRMILAMQGAMGIQKKKAWMNYAAIVSLGGVIGPFISSAAVYRIKALSSSRPEQINWIGLNCGIGGQILTLLPLLAVLHCVRDFTAGMRVFLMFLVMAPQTAANNITTIYFNSHTQQRLSSTERGRFLANILMLFTMGNSAGTLLYGWALASGSAESQIAMSSAILFGAVAMKVGIHLALRADSRGRTTVLLKKDE